MRCRRCTAKASLYYLLRNFEKIGPLCDSCRRELLKRIKMTIHDFQQERKPK